jgi:hypothetical protein
MSGIFVFVNSRCTLLIEFSILKIKLYMFFIRFLTVFLRLPTFVQFSIGFGVKEPQTIPLNKIKHLNLAL